MLCTFVTKQNALLQHCIVKSKIRYQNTLPKYVTKCNVFCVTYSVFFSFCIIVKLGSVARLNFYLLLGDIPSEQLKGHLLLSVHITISSCNVFCFLKK